MSRFKGKSKLITAFCSKIVLTTGLAAGGGSAAGWSRNLFVIAVVTAALGGCGSDPSARTLPQEADEPRQVRMVAATKARVARTVSATGTLAADD
jgi:hypothetical protein